MRGGADVVLSNSFFRQANRVVVGSSVTTKHDFNDLEPVLLSHARSVPSERNHNRVRCEQWKQRRFHGRIKFCILSLGHAGGQTRFFIALAYLPG